MKKVRKIKKKLRFRSHILMCFILGLVIISYKHLLNTNVIDGLLTVDGYTYGPLLGLFAFGILTKHKIKDKYSIIVCCLSVIAVFLLSKIPSELLGGYIIGYELLPINGLITFIGLNFIKKSPSN